LMDQLDIQYASFWGCSSGALAVLALCADYPDRVRNGLPHEAPTWLMDHIAGLAAQDDDSIATTMAFHSKTAVGNDAVWDALGHEVHERLRKNYPRWAHGYVTKLTQSAPVSDEDLYRRPIDWTVGAGSPMYMFFNNVVIATKAGIAIKTLPGNHFPYISHPEEMTKYIVETTRKYI
jgi:pimeloyl-ACP methyl ester carboxylesterase